MSYINLHRPTRFIYYSGIASIDEVVKIIMSCDFYNEEDLRSYTFVESPGVLVLCQDTDYPDDDYSFIYKYK